MQIITLRKDSKHFYVNRYVPSLTTVGPYIFTEGPHSDGIKPTVLSERLKTTLKPCMTTVPVNNRENMQKHVTKEKQIRVKQNIN